MRVIHRSDRLTIKGTILELMVQYEIQGYKSLLISLDIFEPNSDYLGYSDSGGAPQDAN